MINREDDFGFTFVDETEYEAYEKTLEKQIAEHSLLSTSYEKKLDKIMAVINPFLKELGAEPSKIYIKWPKRGERVKAFQDKLNAILNEK